MKCSSCGLEKSIVREDRVVEYEIDDNQKAVSAQQVDHLFLCKDCI